MDILDKIGSKLKTSEQKEIHDKSGHLVNIEERTLKNNNFREILYTTPKSQLAIMSIDPGDDVGEEIHEVDQFIRVEAGFGKGHIGDIEFEVKDGTAIVVPAGIHHNIVNTSEREPLKLYAVYSPPEHQDGLVQAIKEEAKEEEE